MAGFFESRGARTLGAVLLSAVLAACSGDGTGSQKTPTSLDITGAPDSAVLMGTTFQLGAVVRDQAGQAVERTVTWLSRDTTLARVSASGVVTTVRPGVARIVATSATLADSADVTILIPVAQVSVAPSAPFLYAGMSLQLGATLRDSTGAVLTGRHISWLSLDPAKASVDANGRVTALSPGTVHIRATAERFSAQAVLTLLARPVADWSQATDWGTFQGNARHDGFFPVTLDPAVFTTAWTQTVAAGVVLNPPALGGGRVYVSTNAYFGRQLLTALDDAAGTPAWSHDFGQIHGVHPPAYDAGQVYVTTSGHEDSFLWSFDAAAGTLKFRTPYGNQWSRYYAPTVVGQTVYMAGGDYDGMYAFSTDGTQRWFYGLNQYDQWTPAVADGHVYAYTGLYAPKLSVVNATTGATEYEIPDPAFDWDGWSMNTAPVLGGNNDLLATQRGRLVSFDLAGRRIGWTLSGQFRGTVTVANGTAYVFGQGQVEARRESDGALQWVWVLEDGQSPQTIIATRNLLLVSTTAHVYALDLGVHQPVWSYAAGGHIALGKDGLLAIAQQDGRVTAIRVK